MGLASATRKLTPPIWTVTSSAQVVASLVLLAYRRAGTRAGWLPWGALVAGTAASVAANVAVGASDPVGRLVAGWPAVALLVAIKLLAGLLDARSEHVASSGDGRGSAGPVDRSPDSGDPGADRAGTATDHAGPRTVARTRTGPHRITGDRGSAGIDPTGLETAARVARDKLVANGEPVNRRNLAAGLRSAGHRDRNDRLGHLLQVVNAADPSVGVPVGVPADIAGGGQRG
jgi:hypothetical protein